MIRELLAGVTDTVVPRASDGSTPLLLGALGTGIGGLATYFAARRKGSGRIATTDAGTLWDATEDFRKDQAAEIASLRTDNAALRTDNATLRAENTSLRSRIEKLEGKT